MVATFSQFHHRVHQIGDVGSGRAFGQEGEVALQNGAVIFLLDVRQLHLHDRFLFGRQRLLHVLLQSTQHHRLQDLRPNHEITAPIRKKNA